MRRVMATMLGTAAVVLMATSAYAQAPNFAGTWTLDQEKTQAANPVGGGGGGRGGGRGAAPMTITQDAKVLTIARTMGENTITTTYNLDGSPSKNTMMGRGGETTVTSTAKWDGATLVVTSDNGQTIKYSMDGAWLKSETTSPGREGGPAQTRVAFYKKG